MTTKLLSLVLFFLALESYSQNNFILKTVYKQNPAKKFESEKYEFKFENTHKNISITDLDINVTKTYPVQFYDSSYSEDGKFYIVAFMSDMKRFDKLSLDKSFLGMFTFFYDKKNGNLLWVQVLSTMEDVSGHTEKVDYYYTEKGKLIQMSQ